MSYHCGRIALALFALESGKYWEGGRDTVEWGFFISHTFMREQMIAVKVKVSDPTKVLVLILTRPLLFGC